jgi:hypothetical protein
VTENISVALGQRSAVARERVKRLPKCPYFGRVDWHSKGAAAPCPGT